MKKIVVIGTGRMGGTFATAFAKRTLHAVSIRADIRFYKVPDFGAMLRRLVERPDLKLS